MATQPGETDEYTLDDHVQAIEAHTTFIDNLIEHGAASSSDRQGGVGTQQNHGYLFNFVLANNNLKHPIPDSMSHLQAILLPIHKSTGYQVIGADVVDEQYPWRHDSVKLAHQLMESFKQVKSAKE